MRDLGPGVAPFQILLAHKAVDLLVKLGRLPIAQRLVRIRQRQNR